MNTFFQLTIPKRHTHCCNKGERIEPGMEYCSLLSEEDDKEIIRQDYCLPCWKEVSSQVDLNKNFTFWQSKTNLKIALPNSKNKVTRAVSLLKQLINQSEPHDSEIFILALYLARARQLYLRKEFEENGSIYHLYELVEYDEFITVKKVLLTALEAPFLQKKISAQLNS